MNMNILCVDDSVADRSIYKMGLCRALPQDAIVVVNDAKEALVELEQRRFDVVITDLVMPEMDGLELLAHIHKTQPVVQVIMVTGEASVATAVAAMRLGARDYVEKPVSIPLLVEKLENIREYRRRGREAEDFRAAKETVEGQCAEEIGLLVGRIHDLEELLESIEKLSADETLSEGQRLVGIREKLKKPNL